MRKEFEQIKKLIFESNVSNYRISKETGIAQSTLSDYVQGKTKIERMPIETAIILHDYLKKLEEIDEN